MEIKCGTDIIEISRVRKCIEDLGDDFLNKIYTKNEIKYCESKGKQKYQHYAARFAAKEAIFKAISEKLNSKYELSWKDYEILNDQNGRPKIKVGENSKILEKEFMANVESMDISISHCKEYATANVVVFIL